MKIVWLTNPVEMLYFMYFSFITSYKYIHNSYLQ